MEQSQRLSFLQPGIWTALIMNWLQADVQIKGLRKGMISVELDLPLFMQWTAAELSQ